MRFALLFVLASSVAFAEGAIGILFMDDPSPGVLAHFGGVAAGAVVMEAADEGPAAKAGLKLGDVIVAVNGKPISDFAELSKIIGGLDAGASAKITFRRHKEQADGHDEKTVDVSIVDRETFWKAEIGKQQLESKP